MTPQPTNDETLAPTTTAPRFARTHRFALSGYRIERELGRGGQAVVYLARDERSGREVAVKVMAEGPLAMVMPLGYRRSSGL